MRLATICVPLLGALSIAVGASADQPACVQSSALSLKQAFDAMDTNHDGIVSQQEFIAAHHQKALDKAQSVFDKISGGAADLTLAQFTAARQAWEQKLTAERKEWTPEITAQEEFQKMDVNHDGKLSKSEFVDSWVKRADERAGEIFAKLGGTKDKGLTFAQFEKGHEALIQARHIPYSGAKPL